MIAGEGRCWGGGGGGLGGVCVGGWVGVHGAVPPGLCPGGLGGALASLPGSQGAGGLGSRLLWRGWTRGDVQMCQVFRTGAFGLRVPQRDWGRGRPAAGRKAVAAACQGNPGSPPELGSPSDGCKGVCS